ncbi:MAG: hypothetical protein NZ960_03280 [Candidatus Kapabacteria bacterium]|nr:hypothetical protein [Candidatus Kapabacteria bacterium]MDW8012319.1 hypothetical protein [Bacteroidota bacterium]
MRLLLGFWGMLVLGLVLFAQVPPPLELPEVVIVGQEERRIPGGAKQPPAPPNPLPRQLLDTLNPTAKHTLMEFFPKPELPNALTLPSTVHSFVEGRLGQYTTIGIKAFSQWGLREGKVIAAVDGSTTAGHVAFADSTSVLLRGQAQFRLPSALWFFQNAAATVDFSAHWNRYRLFGDSLPVRRSLLRFGGGGELGGRIEDLRYRVGAELFMSSLSQASVGQSEQQLQVEVQAVYPSASVSNVGIRSLLDLRLWGEETQIFSEFGLAAAWAPQATLYLQGVVGIQLARAYTGASFFFPVLEGTVQYRLSEGWRVLARGWSRIHPGGWREIWQTNPYASTNSMPTFPHERLGVSIGAEWSPSALWSMEVSARARSVRRWWSWRPDSVGFLLWALPVEVVELTAHGLAQLSDANFAGGSVLLGRARAHTQGFVAYYAPLQLRARYDRQWRAGLWSTLGIEIVGSRQVAPDRELAAYVRLWGELRYTIVPRLQLTLFADNALNAEIVQWQGYPERGIFVGATLRWVWQ